MKYTFTRLKRLLWIALLLPILVANQTAQSQESTRSAKVALAPIDPQKRVALVIGVSAYPRQPLANPALDATAMAKQLSQLKEKFDVITVIDGDRRTLLGALENFERN